MWSDFGIKFSITPILSETFAPPRIVTNGCTGLSTALPKNLISFSIKKPAATGLPAAFIAVEIPTFEAWLLWAVPNASLINTSPSDAQYSPSLGSFLLSRLPKSLSISWKRVFSINRISPSLRSLIASSSSLPSLVGTNLTGIPLNS